MIRISHFDQVSYSSSWLTIGTFDGVHTGHQSIIKRLVSGAQSAGLSSVVLTFDPHPAVFFGRRDHSTNLTLSEEKGELLEQMGVDVLITLEFNTELSSISARDFIMKLKNSVGMSNLMIGYDFAFGHNREGNAEMLSRLGSEFNFNVTTFPAVKDSGQIISSSNIRDLLQKGEIREANRLLGRPYSLEGLVIPGDQRGRTIGIPTANIENSPKKLLPISGVYASRVVVDQKKYLAATNIGVRPTFGSNENKQHVETHLLDFSGDLYDRQLKLEFYERLRGEKRFADIDSLVTQIRLDILHTRNIFNSG